IGRILILMQAKGKWHKVILSDALYVPDLHGNLISVSQITNHGMRIQFLESSCKIYDQQARHDPTNLTAFVARTKVARTDLQTWHHHLGHINTNSVLQMVKKSMVMGMDIVGSASHKALGTCTPCIKGKQSREDVPKMTNTPVTEPLGCLFSDMCGPMQMQSCQGFNYYVSWIDDYSCKAAIDGIQHKSDVLEHLKAFVTVAELKSGHKLKFPYDKGIKHETTTADSPEFNGVSECFNCMVMKMARPMLEDSGLPKSFWFDAVEYAMYIHNVVPTRSLATNVTPHEAWTGNKPDVSLIRTFGCCTFVHISDSRCCKLDPKFFEETPNHKHLKHVQIKVDPGSDTSEGEGITVPIAPESADSEAEVTELLDANEHPAIFADDDACYRVTSYDKKMLPQPAGTLPAKEHVNSACADPNGDPLTYKEAMLHPDTAEWLTACNEELHSFKQMGIEVRKVRSFLMVVNSKWIFRIKRGPNGEVEKYKARLVVKGFTQVEGIDFDETFAPVVKFTSLRMLLALVAKKDLEVHQMDVKTTYLHGELEEEIYLQPPAGFGVPESKVWKLIKSVYGLKQAGRVWYLRIKSKFEKLRYTCIDSDHSFFTKWACKDSTILYAVIYVDDIILISNSMDALLEAKERRYVEEILKRAGYSDACPIATLALANEHMAKVDASEVDVLMYQSGIGSLMYAMLGTRLDLVYTVGVLSQHMAKLGEAHQCVLICTFKYLRGTADYQLVFDGKKPWELTRYVDADWAGDVNDRCSISGYTFLLAGGAALHCGTPITEAEYIAAVHAAKEATWLSTFLGKIRWPCKTATLLLMDNQSAMAIAWNLVFHMQTKHIDMHYHFLREKVEVGTINLQYVPTGDQVADVLTKGLVKAKHDKFSEAMGMHHTS
ncbi:hypothetical protein EWM64_g8475, partial [Hericium alpestre]